MNRFFFLLLLLSGKGLGQLRFSEQSIDLGSIEEAYEIRGDIVLSNPSAGKIFLMRADADQGVKIYTSKKTLQPNDTCLLVISFIPEHKGKFRKKIQLVSSDRGTPYELLLSGHLSRVKVDDKTACVYFGRQKPPAGTIREIPPPSAGGPVTGTPPPVPPANPEPVRLPAVSAPPPVSSVPPPGPQDPFSEADYKPNNILFLVDVSSSMRDSLKLPVMKTALHTLIDAVRAIDTITFVTYAGKVRVIQEAVSGADKATLHELVDSLKARGMTAGRTAILFSQQLAQKHFIEHGNNQIIVATDGEFRFEQADFQTWKNRQAGKKIVMSTVAFGEDKAALKNLKELARKGEGSFIHIRQKAGSEGTLLEEIKLRSRKS
jgi:uncharacterized protein YegL